MKKIVKKEERNELKEKGIFLEGTFYAQYGNRSFNGDGGEILIGFIAVLICLFGVISDREINGIILIIIAISLMVVVWPCLRNVLMIIYYHTEVAKMITSKELYVNWATIISVDDKNRCISYIEDDALSPQKRSYIVDCVATKKDCYRVLKGERIFILYSKSKNGKWMMALVKVNKNIHLLEENREHEPINITGLVHVPHINAFRMEKNEKDKEVIILTCLSTCRKLKPANIQGPHRGYLYMICEWNGDKCERYYFSTQISIPKRHYGDIMIKKFDRYGNTYFVHKN